MVAQTLGDAPKWVTKASTFVSSLRLFQFGDPIKCIPSAINSISETRSISGASMAVMVKVSRGVSAFGVRSVLFSFVVQPVYLSCFCLLCGLFLALLSVCLLSVSMCLAN